jgi:hypothetical protein
MVQLLSRAALAFSSSVIGLSGIGKARFGAGATCWATMTGPGKFCAQTCETAQRSAAAKQTSLTGGLCMDILPSDPCRLSQTQALSAILGATSGPHDPRYSGPKE